MLAEGRAKPSYSPERPAASLAVVIVTYNSADTLPGLLDSLPAGLAGLARTRVVIADNGSSDNSADIAAAHPIQPTVIRTGRNGGYAAGINAAAGVIASDADLLILNPDIRLFPGSARLLVDRLRDNRVGIAAPRILHENGSLVPSLRREPSIINSWADALLGDRFGARLDIGETIHGDRRYRSGGSVEWASGAALAVAARARALVGEWDESFFLYSEEVDYQRRVRDCGLEVAFVAGSEMIHIGGDYQRNPRLYAMLTANRIRYYARHHGPLATTLFRLAVITGEALRSAKGSPVHRAGLVAAWRRLTRPQESRQAGPA